MAAERKLRMGMVGGGPSAFIGPVHRIAAELDGKIELVAGAFSQSAERSREAGVKFQVDPERAYEVTSLGLKEAKDRVDGAPKAIKESATKDEAEAIRKKFEGIATIEIK